MKTTAKSKWEIVSEIELVYKPGIKNTHRPKVTSSRSAYQLAVRCWDPDKIEFIEQFKILLLNQSNTVLGLYEVSSGGLTGTVVDIRLVFSAALKAGATGIIMIHNHPSGRTVPSRPDTSITRKVGEAGRLLDILLLDHLIITPESFYSFADDGAL